MKSICFFNWYNFQNFWDSRLELKKKRSLTSPVIPQSFEKRTPEAYITSWTLMKKWLWLIVNLHHDSTFKVIA